MPFADPDKARIYQREFRRLRRAGDGCTTPGTSTIPTEFRLQTAQDAIDLLEEQIGAVRDTADGGPLEEAHCVGYLAGVALKAIEAGNLEALEAVLKQRNGERRP